ncbi:1-piperideine-2-carboxylate/1-pyrroline-2-carboxylate reductase [NAD(P)H] [Microbacterium paludicola]|uniref:1-piperideine-2-carboxylate/1-pyrroline-2-carboxylate reductase [NAD(P)H] n=1 Tax=Microbacterium paludicola TaxID=300019 RepID=A0ABU1I1C5_9MICO|nr:ornithine cyclodeaminase family protein [Microbacterium paludicola]MDR6167691.1 1-piperideine-2-carboxylate/1-pyrroline-2-carboxylate reductase [NAD(P)H] [Microbacterium paludicola]
MSAASAGIPVVSAADIERAMTPPAAVEAIDAALRSGLDVEADHERIFAPLSAGDFLLMPSESPDAVGIKVATIAPGNTRLGLPKISAWYLVFDRATLQPAAIVDGTRLTTLRTPAVTAVAVRGLLAADPRGARRRIDRLAVLGSGPQAIEHATTLAAILPVGEVTIVGRTPERVEDAVAILRDRGIDARTATLAAARDADVVVTATSSSTPVLDLDDIAPGAVVAAVGAHGLDHRELGSDLVRAADIVVEARASAVRESGNLAGATRGGEPLAEPANLVELVSGRLSRRPGAPAVYTGVGMAWEDLAVVQGIMEVMRRGSASEETT